MTDRTYPGKIAAIIRGALASTAGRMTLTEERTGGDGRARFSAFIDGEWFTVSVAREPHLATIGALWRDVPRPPEAR